MPRLVDFRNADFADIVGHMAFNDAGLSASAGAVTYATTATVKYTIDGAFKSKTAASAQSLVTNSNEGYTAAQMVVPAATTAYFVVALNAAGDVKNFSNMSTVPGGSLIWPSSNSKVPKIPAGWCPIGIIKIVTGTTAFTPATTFLDATTGGMVITYTNVSLLPLAESP